MQFPDSAQNAPKTIPLKGAKGSKTTFISPPLDTDEYGDWKSHAYGPGGVGNIEHFCIVEVAPGMGVFGCLKGNTLAVTGGKSYSDFHDRYEITYWPSYYILNNATKVDPFIEVEITGPAYTRDINVLNRNRNHWGYRNKPEAQRFDAPDGYSENYGYSETGVSHLNNNNRHYSYGNGPTWMEQRKAYKHYLIVPVRITVKDTGETYETELKFKQPRCGDIDLTRVPDAASADNVLATSVNIGGYVHESTYSVAHLKDLLPLLKGDRFNVKQSKDTLWAWFFNANHTPKTLDEAENSGVKSLWRRKLYRDQLAKLEEDEPLLNRFLFWLMDKRVDNKTSNNKLIKTFIETCGEDYDKLRDGLRDVMDRAVDLGTYDANGYTKNIYNRSLCLGLPGAADAELERKAKEAWQYQKTMTGKAGGLGISEDDHPTLHGLVATGEIPLSIFHAPGEKQHIINNEFDLWEKALTTPGWKDAIIEIATDVSRRTTYDKPVTPYLAFLMWTLPRYLDRVAPRPKGGSWSCLPKFVESQWELEMDEATEEGTVKRRSAMTPIVDNETGVVTVPYLSMAIHGRMTTYCYSGKYYVSNQGDTDPLGDGVWTGDFVEKLNGRDDYGLMFYTLIGTDRNTGYPSFLVILERLNKRQKDTGLTTRVHFHRVRPNRSKNGIPTPTNQLIEECYRYMAGNVKAEEIENQQGDLIFIRVDKPGRAVEDPVPVRAFESHAFVPLEGTEACTVIRSTAKAPTNRLGYLHAKTAFKVEHPEHEDIDKLDAGWWEIRRCKSYENNPVAVWSLTID